MILAADFFSFTDAIPWVVALLGVVVALYFSAKNLKLAREKNQREIRKHEKDEILKNFPNTSHEDIAAFMANNTAIIESELKKGNHEVLSNPLLTIESLEELNGKIDEENTPGTFYKILINALAEKFEEQKLRSYKKKVITWLTEKGMLKNDKATIRFLLGFELYPNDPEHQKEEIEAMKFLRKKDFKKWRELLALATQEREDDDDRWVNALYFFKMLN